MFSRNATENLLKLAKEYRVILLTGPRQSGKSTILKNVFPNYRYVNFEQINVRNFAQNDPIAFLEQYDRHVIFDEIQRVPDILSYIQMKVDENEEKGRFILSGSQNILLMDNVSQSLAGRVAIQTLLPLSLDEYSKKPEKEVVANWIFSGGYPELLRDGLDPSTFYSNYIATYIERDVRLLQNIHDLSQFADFMIVLAARIGSEINYQDISNIIGISTPTVKKWISVLEASYIVYTLNPFYKNYDKRIVKSSKLYFYDTGIAANLLNIKSPLELKTHSAFGHLFENMVINEKLKSELNAGNKTSFYFWQDTNKKEIDLVIPRATEMEIYEIKSAKTLKLEFAKNLNDFEKMSGEKVRKTVIYDGTETFKSSDGVTFSSWTS